MKINKITHKGLTYYECEVNRGTHLLSFTLRGIIVDLFRVYSFNLFNQVNLN